jgi:glycosyltransferase involved in cell wall biosynthesis
MLTGKNMEGRISVVMPLYNHEGYVAQALESIFAQTVRPLEVIVIDDGSRDKSAAVARDFLARHPDLVFWSHPNQGTHYTINAGIHRARGEFISILNSDDAYHPERFADCLRIFDSHEEVSAVTTALSFIDDKNKAIRNPWYEQARAFYAEVGDLSLALVNGNFLMTTSNLIVRRSVFQEIGYFSALRYAHDLDFFLRLLVRGKRIYWLDRPLLSYRLHVANTIREDALRVKAEWAAVVAFFIVSRRSKLLEGQQDWSYYSKLTEITDRHGLTRLLVYFFAFFERLPSAERTLDAFTRDEDFGQFLVRAVR